MTSFHRTWVLANWASLRRQRSKQSAITNNYFFHVIGGGLDSCFHRKDRKGIYGLRVLSLFVLVISLFLLVFPQRVIPFSPSFAPFSFFHPFQLNNNEDVKPISLCGSSRSAVLDHSAELVSIAQLLSEPNLYHQKIIKVRGTVTQPELHVDESRLFIRFVFVLKELDNTLIVFGHHDRTQGNIQIETNEQVEVIGIFWKERTANDHHFRNNLEAITVTRYPPLHPHAA